MTRLQNKKTKGLLGVVALLFAFVLSGCGGKTTTSDYYYNPAWTADGKILATRERIETVTQGGLGGGSNSQIKKNHWVIMNADGSGEREILGLGYEEYMRANASPSGNYVVTVGGIGLEVWSYPGFQKVSDIEIPRNDGVIREFDWSPDETKIVVRTESGGAKLYTRDGAFVSALNSLGLVQCWKYAPNIIGQYGNYPNNVIRMVSETGDIIHDAMPSGADQYYPGGTYFLGGVTGNTTAKRRTSDFTVIETYPSLDAAIAIGEPINGEHQLATNPLNPTNVEEVMFTTGYTNYGGGAKEGIGIVNVDGTNRRIIK
ncbi:MAG: TolB family protein [Candidatus Margulisiibacteriota bacterium]